MSKRRTKKQQKKVEAGMQLILLLVGGTTWFLTQQLYPALISVVVAMIVIIVVAAFIRKREKERLRNSGIADIDRMNGIEFEHYLKELYQSRGYTAEVTSASGDYGADLLLKKDGRKIVVQAKRYAKDVGIKAVQEVMGAKSYYRAEEARVVSNSYFTKAARELAAKGQVMLVNRDELIDYILQLNPGIAHAVPLKMVDSESSSSNETCGKCGSPMVLRKGKRGEFLGCSSFPKCRNTRELQTK
ncbi:restriction endonuclease [Neobacillus niacini]|uniref:restriction endonuclease n=1 Tax=Neobacillus niacini TaxID=86668 RepID=UPI0030008B5C